MARAPRMAPEQRRALDRLSPLLGPGEFYLAGGAAVAWHLGHRTSLDLDLFSRSAHASLPDLERRIVGALPDAEVLSSGDATARVRIGAVPIDLVAYPYPPLEEPERGVSNVPVAGLRDLAAMKLAAIARRGLRRDFWDLHEIATRAVPLEDALAAYRARYGRTAADDYHVVRALTWFEDAEREPAFPLGLDAETWEDIEAWFRDRAPALAGR